jgi:hypothetical protein
MGSAPAHAGSQSFDFSYSNYVQSQTFTVPAGVTAMNVTLSGGPGGCGGWDVWDDPNGARTGGASGGAAKIYKAAIKVTPGEQITLSQGGVGTDGYTCGGCGGATGGGSAVSSGGAGGYTGWHGFSGSGAGGGGASAIYKSSGEAFIIAGGGGGGTGASRACPNYNTAAPTAYLYAVNDLRTVSVGSGGAGANFGGADGSGGGGGGGGYTAGSGGYGQWDVNTALPQYGVSYCSPGGSGGGGSSAYNPNLVSSINESGAVASCSGATASMAVAWDAPTTLQMRQLVQSPVPINLRPPYTFSYLGNNGWSIPPLKNTALNVFNSSDAIVLATNNTDTTVSIRLPEPRYFISSFSCVDTNAAQTHNPTGNLVSGRTTSVTIPAANVRAGSALRCTVLLGHFTP